jgi:Fe(3+) dicitrate transport protein
LTCPHGCRASIALFVAAGLLPARAAWAQDEEEAEEDPPEEQVTVAGTRVEQTSGSAHYLDEDDLGRFEYDDPHKLFTQVPGVYVRGEDGQGLRPNIGMRGALSDRSKKVTLMEDGVLFGPAPYSAPAAYYFPLITRMSAVRVIKGPSAISFGPHTVAGAIDLMTAPIPDGVHAMADLAFGQYLSRKGHVRASVQSGGYGLLVEGVHLGNEGFKDLDGGGDTGFVRSEVMAKARASFGGPSTLFHTLELKLGFSNETSHETYLGLTDADFEATPYRRYGASRLDRMEWDRTQVVFTHMLSDGEDLELTTTIYRHDLHRTWRKVNAFRGAALSDVLGNPGTPRNQIFYGVLTGAFEGTTADEVLMIGPNDRDFVSEGAQAVLHDRIFTGPIEHRIEIGTRLHYDEVERRHTQDGFFVRGTGVEPEGGETEVTAENEASTFALALHALDAVTWGPVTVTAGVRAESIHGRVDDALSGKREGLLQQVVLPGAGVFVALPLDFGLLAGVYQGFSPIPPGQPSIVRPEKSVNYEFGARWSPEVGGTRIEAIGFVNDYSNLSNVCTFSSGCVATDLDQQFDGGSALVAGLEAFAHSDVPITEDVTLPLRGAYTFTHARFASDFSSADPIFGEVHDGDTVPYVPEHQLSASVGVETPWAGANLSGTYSAAMREVAGSGDPLPGEATDAYFLLDASIHGRPLPWLDLYVTGKNLLDTTYIAARRPFGARPGAPIWIQGGTKVTF